MYPFKGFEPLTIKSTSKLKWNGSTYERRLTINLFNLLLLKEKFGEEAFTELNIDRKDNNSIFLINEKIVKDVYSFLSEEVSYHPSTYLFINYKISSFSRIP